VTWEVIGAVAATAVSSAGLVRLIDAVARKRVTRIEVAERVNEMALEWAGAVQEDAAAALKDAQAARADAAAARGEVDQLNRALRSARREVDRMARRLEQLHAAITSEHATLDSIRLAAGIGNNGRAP
jgi:chromosome segregation ATPase